MREPCLKEKGGIAARQVSKLNARASLKEKGGVAACQLSKLNARASLKEKGASLHINFQS